MIRIYKNSIIILLIILFLLMPGHALEYTKVKVVDSYTGNPINGAFVTLNNDVLQTGEDGVFIMKSKGDKVAVRAWGYLRTEQATTEPIEIKLLPFKPKGLYLSFYGIAEQSLREAALKLIEDTELNTLVIDVKGDRGRIVYKSSIPLASDIGAQKMILVKDIKGLIQSLKGRGIYTIARIVVFKDDILASARPDLAVRTKSGEVWHDREDLEWVDPFGREVWDYNINIAVEAAQYGFDEIQFDYVRFPDSVGLKFSMESTEENRVNAISGFLREAKRRLIPYNVFLSVDIFGYVCWNLNDSYIGQKLDELMPLIDYISPMLYPSAFQYGIPGSRNPVVNPHKIVYLSLKRAQERTNLPSIRFRPWLQAFRDYAFDRRYFSSQEIRAQINAAEDFGSDGWMLWNPQNIYSPVGLKQFFDIIQKVGH